MAFDAEEVEDGTGKPDAIVYEQAATAAAWLARRGYTRFSTKTESEQEAIMINATQIGEEAIRPRFVGFPIADQQALLWPAHGAPDWRDAEVNPGAVPDSQKEGVRLICEKLADGSYESTLSSAGIRRERHNGKELEYQMQGRGASFAELFPEIFSVLRKSLPRSIT